MAELSRRGFFKGLFGLALVAAVGKPEVATATVPPVSGLAIQMRERQKLLLDLATYGTVAIELTPGRINRFKGEILKHAVPFEMITSHGWRRISGYERFDGTYIARRYLPYGK